MRINRFANRRFGWFLYVVSCELCNIRSSTLGTLGIFVVGRFLRNQHQAQRIGLVDFVGDVETVGCCQLSNDGTCKMGIRDVVVQCGGVTI